MNNYPYSNYMPPVNNNRQFVFPFLTGALVGGAAVGLTRPRPIYNVAPNNGPRPPFGPRPPYSYYSYGGYIPGPYY